MPVPDDDPVDLEMQGWTALCSGGQTARLFYDRVLNEAPVMLLPGGLVLDQRAAIIDSMSGQPWSTFQLENVRSFQPAPDTAMVIYGVTAFRDGRKYSALVSSAYVACSDAWRLAFHQQTPR